MTVHDQISRRAAGALLAAAFLAGCAHAQDASGWVGRWTGVVHEAKGDFRADSLADIEFKAGPDGALSFIDNDRQRNGAAVPVRIDGHAFAANYAGNTVVDEGGLRAEGVLSADGKSIALTIRRAGMTGQETKTATLRRDDPAARKFLAPRLDAKGGRVTTYAYAAPAAREDGVAVSTAAAEHIDPAKLEALAREILGQGDGPTDIRTESVLISRNGKLVFEEYFWGQDAGNAHIISSSAKSLTAIITGAAWDKGLIDLDRPAASYFPERKDVLWAKEGWPITVRNVLSMSSGTAWDDTVPPPNNPSINLLATQDVAGYVMGKPLIHPPGSFYQYDNGLPSLMGPLVAKVTGKSLEAFADEAVFAPMGIRNYRWTPMREGVPLAAGGFFMTPRDMTKLGQMMLDGGVWNGKRIVSEAWVRESTAKQTAAGQYPYGFYWHLSNDQKRRFGRYDAFMALGQAGQVIIVLPEPKVVAVFTSSNWRAPNVPAWKSPEAVVMPFDLIDQFIVPAIQ